MKFLIFLAALAAVSYAEVEVFINGNEIVDDRLKNLDLFNQLTVKHGDAENIIVDDIEGKNIVNDKIIAWLEEARLNFGTGVPDKGIPPLDPFTMDTISVKYSFPLLFKAVLSIRNSALVGLQQFLIENISFNILRLSFDFGLMIPDAKYDCDFDVDGRITLVVPFNFGGHMRLRFRKFDFSGKAALGTNADGYLNLKEFFINFQVEKTSIYFDNVIGNGPLNDIFNWLLSQLTNGTIKNIVAGLSDALSAMLFEVINTALGSIKLGDLIG